MPWGKTHMGSYVPFVDFCYAHIFLRCFLVVATCSVSMLWHCHSPNRSYAFDVTKLQAGVDCAQKFLVEVSNISLRRPIATNLARIRGFDFNLCKNY